MMHFPLANNSPHDVSRFHRDGDGLPVPEHRMFIDLEPQRDQLQANVRILADAVGKDSGGTMLGIEPDASVHVANEKAPSAHLPTTVLQSKNRFSFTHQFVMINL